MVVGELVVVTAVVVVWWCRGDCCNRGVCDDNIGDGCVSGFGGWGGTPSFLR